MQPSQTPALVQLWDRAAAAFADRPALGIPGCLPVTFTEIQAEAHRIAHDLRDRGLRPGDAILISLARGPAWLPALLGIWEAGGVAVPVASRDPATITSFLQQTGARFRFCDGPPGPGWPAAYVIERHDPPATAPAELICPAHAYAMPTSGSTGLPKLALVTHRTSASVMSGLAAAAGIGPGEHALHTAAFTFSSSIRQLFVPLLSGAQVTVLAQDGPYMPGRLLAVASAAGITSLDLTPSHMAGLVQILETDPDVSRPVALRRLMVASETLTSALVTRWRRAVQVPHELVHLYGQTETGGAVSALRHADTVAPGSARLPLALPFQPFTPHFDEYPDGTAELLLAGLDPADGILSGNTLDRGRHDPAHPAGAGLHRTGDLFTRDPGGWLFFHGRADEQIKILGIRVDIATLEQEISALPGVGQAVAAAVPRGAAGTMVGIGYTAAPAPAGPADDLISAEAARRLHPALPPPRAVRLNEVPLNRSGKVDRPAVLAAIQAGLGTVTATPADPLLTLWRRHTTSPGPAEPHAGDTQHDFFTAGGDSLSMISLLADVARTLGVRLLPEQFHREPTLAALRKLVTAGQQAITPEKPAAPAPPAPITAGVGVACAATAFQRGLWIHEQVAGRAPSPYWLPIDIEVTGHLDLERLTDAFRAILTRFDALRLAFAAGAGSSLTMIPDAHRPETATLRGTAGTGQASLGPITQTDPLVSLAASTGGGRTKLSLRVHHAVADRPSLATILRALCGAYEDPGPAGSLPPGPSFVRWAGELSARAAGSHREAARRFWDSWLPEPARSALPAGHPPAGRLSLTVTPTPMRARAPLGATRPAAWLWAFHRALAQAGLPQAGLIGVDVDVRPPEVTDLVGPCINTLPVVLPPAAPDNAGERTAGAAIACLLPYADVPISDVVSPPRRPTGDPRQPFFRYLLVHQRSAYPELRLGGFAARYTRLPAGISEHSVTLFVRDLPDRTELELAWNKGLLTASVAHVLLASTTARFREGMDGQP